LPKSQFTSSPQIAPEPVRLPCRDGFVLHGHLWPSQHPGSGLGLVIINAATGVLAKYYHYYARYLAEQGFTALTYDYRGIGASRPNSLRGVGFRWRDWGELDFDAAVHWAREWGARERGVEGPLSVVGHSIGGFLPGFAPAAAKVDRILSVGAQYAFWRDYAPAQRMSLFLKWHVAMPALTAMFGYFPGKRLGWLEDLPAGVAYEWSFRRARLEQSFPAHEHQDLLSRFAQVSAPILAIGVSDDEFGTPEALRRGLEYYSGSPREMVMFEPSALGFGEIGHFSLFHARHREGFWRGSCDWLRDGVNPWPPTLSLSPTLPS